LRFRTFKRLVRITRLSQFTQTHTPPRYSLPLCALVPRCLLPNTPILPPPCFGHSSLWISHLFRISIFDFRISPRTRPAGPLQLSSALYKSPPFAQNKPNTQKQKITQNPTQSRLTKKRRPTPPEKTNPIQTQSPPRFTLHPSRFTRYASRFTLPASRFTSYPP